MKRVSELASELRPFLQNISSQVIAVDDGRIRLLQAGGSTVRYDPTDAGLTAALAAAGAGDAVILPACAISGTGWTVAAGVTLLGQGEASELTGALTVNGAAMLVRVVGGIIGGASSIVSNCHVKPVASGTGILLSGTRALAIRCLVDGVYTASYGIKITGNLSRAEFCQVEAWSGSTAGVCDVGIYLGSGASAYMCSGNGELIGIELVGGVASHCQALAANGAGLKNTSGTGGAYHVVCSGTGYDIQNASGTLNVYACFYADSSGTLTYLTGDRGAYSVEDYHASDIEAAALTRHLPTPPAAGFGVVSNGTNWVASGSAITQGSGSAGQMAYWSSANALTGSIGNVYDDATVAQSLTRYGGTPTYAFARADGTSGSPSYVANNVTVGQHVMQAYNGSGFTTVAVVRGTSTQAHSSGSLGTRLDIRATGNGGSLSTVASFFGDGKVGINTTGPDKALEINDSAGACLRLTYNDSNGSATNYADFAVNSSGDLTITPSGGDTVFSGLMGIAVNPVISGYASVGGTCHGYIGFASNALNIVSWGTDEVVDIYSKTGGSEIQRMRVGATVTVYGNTVLGDASTDTITCNGRLLVRTAGSDPQHATPGSRPAGTLKEIVYYSGKLYFCTNASTPTWEKITSA